MYQKLLELSNIVTTPLPEALLKWVTRICGCFFYQFFCKMAYLPEVVVLFPIKFLSVNKSQQFLKSYAMELLYRKDYSTPQQLCQNRWF